MWGQSDRRRHLAGTGAVRLQPLPALELLQRLGVGVRLPLSPYRWLLGLHHVQPSEARPAQEAWVQRLPRRERHLEAHYKHRVSNGAMAWRETPAKSTHDQQSDRTPGRMEPVVRRHAMLTRNHNTRGRTHTSALLGCAGLHVRVVQGAASDAESLKLFPLVASPTQNALSAGAHVMDTWLYVKLWPTLRETTTPQRMKSQVEQATDKAARTRNEQHEEMKCYDSKAAAEHGETAGRGTPTTATNHDCDEHLPRNKLRLPASNDNRESTRRPNSVRDHAPGKVTDNARKNHAGRAAGGPNKCPKHTAPRRTSREVRASKVLRRRLEVTANASDKRELLLD